MEGGEPRAVEKPLSAGGLYQDTLQRLLTPRRSIPIALVCATLVASELQLARNGRGALLALVLCATFLLTAPYLWRRLKPASQSLAESMLGLAAYGAVGALVPLVLAQIPQHFPIGPTVLTDPSTIYVSVALFWGGGWGLGRDLDGEEDLQRARDRAAALEREAERAQLLAVRRHLDPHFLFNTLNAIAEWCREDAEVAERALLQLSDLLRTVLDSVPLSLWPLSRELELARSLLELHLTRDPEAFSVDWQVDHTALAEDVPPLVLLPLVENSVKYGPGAGHRGTIGLLVRKEGDKLVFQLTNPGVFRGRRSDGTGLDTVEKRLLLAYGPEASLSIEPSGDSTVTLVRIPTNQTPLAET